MRKMSSKEIRQIAYNNGRSRHLTKRESIACQLLAGMLTNDALAGKFMNDTLLTRGAVALADALLLELVEQGEEER